MEKYTFGGRILAVSAVLLCLVAAWSRCQDWPRWRGPDGNGITKETLDPQKLAGGPKIVWQASVGIGFSSVAVAGPYLYTMGNTSREDTVYCLDVDSGEEVWRYSYPCAAGSYAGPRATPAVDGDSVYTLSREGHLHCFDARTGAVIWKKQLFQDFRITRLRHGHAGSPIIVGNLLILNAGTAGLALDKRTGAKVWDNGVAGAGYATPVIYQHEDKTAVAILGSEYVHGVEASTGKILWSYPFVNSDRTNAADPVVKDGRVFVSSAYGKGCAVIDFSGGKPYIVWESGIFLAHFTSFVLIDGYLYGNDGDARSAVSSHFRCVEFDTGREMWSEKISFGSPIAAGDKLIILNSIGKIFVAEATPQEYRQVASTSLMYDLYWTPPVFVRGRLYCRSQYGDLYCIDVGP
jgi:outer membrane protein assembly factor BamB